MRKTPLKSILNDIAILLDFAIECKKEYQPATATGQAVQVHVPFQYTVIFSTVPYSSATKFLYEQEAYIRSAHAYSQKQIKRLSEQFTLGQHIVISIYLNKW